MLVYIPFGMEPQATIRFRLTILGWAFFLCNANWCGVPAVLRVLAVGVYVGNLAGFDPVLLSVLWKISRTCCQ